MWDLAILPFVAGLVILSIHAYLGLHVIIREIIFVDLAFAQIAALGAVVGIAFGAHEGTAAIYLFTIGFTLSAALLFSLIRLEDTIVPMEAIIGTTFVMASAAVVLVAGFTAEGTEQHLAETLTGALLWVSGGEIVVMAVAYALIGLFYYRYRLPLLRVSLEPKTAPNRRFWDFMFYASFGVAITFSVMIAGVLLVFSMLVVPAVIAFLYTRQFNPALIIAWVSGAICIAAGLVASFIWDFPTGPAMVCTFGVVLVIAGLLRRVIRRTIMPPKQENPEELSQRQTEGAG